MNDNSELSFTESIASAKEFFDSNDVIWIGPRESDIEGLDLFRGSITIFGSDAGDNTSMRGVRRNHNRLSKEIDRFYRDSVSALGDDL